MPNTKRLRRIVSSDDSDSDSENAEDEGSCQFVEQEAALDGEDRTGEEEEEADEEVDVDGNLKGLVCNKTAAQDAALEPPPRLAFREHHGERQKGWTNRTEWKDIIERYEKRQDGVASETDNSEDEDSKSEDSRGYAYVPNHIEADVYGEDKADTPPQENYEFGSPRNLQATEELRAMQLNEDQDEQDVAHLDDTQESDNDNSDMNSEDHVQNLMAKLCVVPQRLFSLAARSD